MKKKTVIVMTTCVIAAILACVVAIIIAALNERWYKETVKNNTYKAIYEEVFTDEQELNIAATMLKKAMSDFNLKKKDQGFLEPATWDIEITTQQSPLDSFAKIIALKLNLHKSSDSSVSYVYTYVQVRNDS